MQQSCRLQYHIKFLFCWLEYTTKNILLRTSIKTRSASKKSFVMSLPHEHHPTHSLSMVGDSWARNHHLTSCNNTNPYPHNFPGYIRSIYVQNNQRKSILYWILLKNKWRREDHEWPSFTLSPCTARNWYSSKTIFDRGTIQICFFACLWKYF